MPKLMPPVTLPLPPAAPRQSPSTNPTTPQTPPAATASPLATAPCPDSDASPQKSPQPSPPPPRAPAARPSPARRRSPLPTPPATASATGVRATLESRSPTRPPFRRSRQTRTPRAAAPAAACVAGRSLACERIPLRHRSNLQEKNNIVIPEFSAWLTLVLEQCRAENIRNLPRQRAPTPLFPERRPREACSMPISGCHDLPLATFNLPSRNNPQNKRQQRPPLASGLPRNLDLQHALHSGVAAKPEPLVLPLLSM